MIHARHRTVALARLLRATPAATRRRGRMPRQMQPDGIRLEYYKAIREKFIAPALRAFAAERGQILRDYADEVAERDARATSRKDAPVDRSGRAKEMVDRAARRASASLQPRELEAVAAQFGKRTTDFQRDQLDRQVRQAIGVPYSAIERPVRDLVPGFVRDNVDLIASVQERYFDSLREKVEQTYSEGWSVDRLADELSFRDDVAESDARRIARDQVGKLNAEVNQERQTSLGVDSYVWRGSMDNRERDEHRRLEGQSFRWDSEGAPGADVDGGPAHPGEPIMCRCYAEPDFSAIRGEVDEE